MKIRAFDFDDDFDAIKTWITDERTHMMWCANLIPYVQGERIYADDFYLLHVQG